MAVPEPKPAAGVSVESLVWHSFGSLLKAEQMVSKRLCGSRLDWASVPLIMRVGEPPTLYLVLSSLLIYNSNSWITCSAEISDWISLICFS